MKQGQRVVAAGLLVLFAIGGLMVANVIANDLASRRIAAALDHAIALLPPSVTVKYDRVSYSFLARRATLTGLELTSRAGGFSGSETIDRVEITGASWDLVERLEGLKAMPTLATRDLVLPVADHLVFSGVAAQAPNLRLSLAQLEVTGMRLRPWALFQPGVPTAGTVLQQMLAPPVVPEGPGGDAAALAQGLPLLRFAAAAALALEYDTAVETGLHDEITIPATADQPAQQRSVTLGRVETAGGVHGAAVGPVHYRDIGEGFGGASQVTIASLDAGGFDFHDAAERLVGGAPLSADLVNGIRIGDLVVAGVTGRVPSAGDFTIARIVIDGIGFGNGVLESAHAGIEQLHLGDAILARTPSAAAALRSLDLRGLTISAAIGYRWDIARQAITLDRTALRIDELGSLDVDARVDAVSPTQSLQELRDAAVVTQATLRYRDASFAGRLIAAGAAQAQIDPPAMRQRLIDIVQERAANLGSGPAVASLVGALADFIRAPGSLTVTMKPPVPLPLSDLLMQHDQDPQTLLDRLGVAASAGR